MEKTIKLSTEQCDKIISYIENNGIEIYVDYRDELSEEDVERILEGKADEVRWEIEENCFHDEVPDYYWDDLCEEVGITQEQLELFKESEDMLWPSWYLDDHGWNRLVGNTSVNIVGIMWDCNWDFYDWAYGGPLYYRDVKESLRVLGVNPKDLLKRIHDGEAYKAKGWFPDMPDRVPAVNVDDLLNNMIVLYNGVMHFCLGDLADVMDVVSSDSKTVVIKKGTNVVMYDRMNGAGITDLPLTRDITVERSLIEFRNDSDRSNGYGVQACYGFTQSYWNEGSIQNGK